MSFLLIRTTRRDGIIELSQNSRNSRQVGNVVLFENTSLISDTALDLH